ncbi:MAG: hypothetical protein ABIQ40_11055 [Bacteroidia bacterium]
MLKSLTERQQLLILLLLTAITRIPFIFDGYGVEEDSWGLVVNAFEMKNSGHYVASRFPGHPLQEYVYRFIYDQPAPVYNLFSVLASLIAVAFFFKALKKIQFKGAFAAAVMFCFTPVFYIAGTYTIDFAWTVAFVMVSLYYLLDRKFIMSGIMLGMATGCRLTSEIFLLPWLIIAWNTFNWKTSVKDFMKIAIPAVIIGILWFIPAYMNYGKAFFDYSDQFPYPSIAKVIYKASIGVFGLTGIIALVVFGIISLNTWRKKELNPVTLFSSERLLLVCAVVIGMHIVSYLRLPQKSGYMVPAIPFFIIFIVSGLKEKQIRMAALLFIIAPFLFSINLTDNLRGAAATPFAMTFKVSGQEIFLDPLSGSVFSERSKRINKMKYCDSVISTLEKMDTHYVIISGWWFNEIQTYYYQAGNQPNHYLRFYEACDFLYSLKKANMEVYYLPEQNLYNDQMFNQHCTDSLAKPFPTK